MRFENGLGMNVHHHPQRTRDLRGRHLEQRVIVRRGQAIAIDEIDLELAVRILVIDLVDVETGLLQRLPPAVGEIASSREPLVVVAGLVERIGSVEWHECAVGPPLEQHEFRLDAGVHRPSERFELPELRPKRDARAVFVGLAQYMAVARDPRIARHPGDERQRRKIADRHVFGAVRAHAETPYREPRETYAGCQQRFEMRNGNTLCLRGAMNVDELREDELDLVLLEKFPCLGCGHSYGSSTRQKS